MTRAYPLWLLFFIAVEKISRNSLKSLLLLFQYTLHSVPVVPREGLEPSNLAVRDFESRAYTNSAISACVFTTLSRSIHA